MPKSNDPKSIAERWKSGTKMYQDAFAPVAKEIHEKAAGMPHGTDEEAGAIVEMAVTRIREFADEYHATH